MTWCGYCNGLRSMCTCETDCGSRGFTADSYTCPKAPDSEQEPRPTCPRCGKEEAGHRLDSDPAVRTRSYNVIHTDGTTCEWTEAL